jgi:LmbE family N-acetylglucosaminyl deacetylase
MKRILVIAAHPDDEVLGCGATISKYLRRGSDFFVLFIAEGSSCRYSDPASADSLAAIAKRTRQATSALDVLGVNDYHFCNLPCGRIDQVPIIEINRSIEQTIHEFKPDVVLTHSSVDANNDHRIIFRATIMATRPCIEFGVSRLLSYEVLSSSEWAFGNAFVPSTFEMIEERDLSIKCQALLAYDTEVKAFPFPRSEESVRALAMHRGVQSGVPLAEAFCLIREFMA